MLPFLANFYKLTGLTQTTYILCINYLLFKRYGYGHMGFTSKTVFWQNPERN